MTTLEQKKLNVLVHLAKADGKFARSERQLLEKFFGDVKGARPFMSQDTEAIDWAAFESQAVRTELLYCALQLIQADGVVDPREVTFATQMARKLQFQETVIEHFLTSPLPARAAFEQALQPFEIK